MVSIALITAAFFHGIAAMMEHPAFLQRHATIGAASVWRLPELLRLMSLDCCVVHRVYQSNYGMPAFKPTFFVGWHLPSMAQALVSHLDPIDRSLIVSLQGRNADGSFRSAVGKEYPS